MIVRGHSIHSSNTGPIEHTIELEDVDGEFISFIEMAMRHRLTVDLDFHGVEFKGRIIGMDISQNSGSRYTPRWQRDITIRGWPE